MINYTMRVIVHVETCLTEYLSMCVWNTARCYTPFPRTHLRKTSEENRLKHLGAADFTTVSQNGTLTQHFSHFPCDHLRALEIESTKRKRTNYFPFSTRQNEFRQSLPYFAFCRRFSLHLWCWLCFGVPYAPDGQRLTDTSVNTKYRIIHIWRIIIIHTQYNDKMRACVCVCVTCHNRSVDCIIRTVNMHSGWHFECALCTWAFFLFVYRPLCNSLLNVHFAHEFIFYAYH